MNVIITGASRGIGYATALRLSDQGHRILALSRNLEKLQALQKAEGQNGIEILSFDLANCSADQLLEKVNRMGGVDILINNAGHIIKKPFEQLTKADWRLAYEVNLFGVVELIQILLPFLKESPNAHILNVSSMGGFQGSSKFPGLVAYSSSKGALSNLTECLAEEFKEYQVKVNCLALGAVQTEMLAEAFPGYQAPLQASEMAEFMAYFAIQGHRFFNGKVLPVSVSTP